MVSSGPTRALFERTQVDYQNNLRPTSWLTLTSGFYYSRINAGQERPFVSQRSDHNRLLSGDHTQEIAGIAAGDANANRKFDLCRRRPVSLTSTQFGGVWTYRVAGSYKIDKTNTTLHSSVATGFSPPSSQDIIFGNNPNLEPEKDFGWDIGVRQELWQKRVALDLTYFHNDLSNVIGFNGLFQTLNLGAAETQGLEAELRAATDSQSRVHGELYISRHQKRLRRQTFRSRKARVCRVGRAMKFIFLLRIFG